MSTTNSTPFDFKGYSILIIDDNPTNLGVVVDYLENYGFEILVARHGMIGLKRARQAQPDIILLDVIMPEVDGFEIGRRLKANPRTMAIPIIFMTALNRVEDKVRGFQIGAVDYVTKPIQQEEVLARIRTHLKIRDLTQRLELQNMHLQQVTDQLAKANLKLSKRVDQEKERARDLAERNLVISKAVEASSDAVAMSNTDGTITYLNPTFTTLFGYTLEELNRIGGPKAIFIEPKLAQQMINALEDENGQSWSAETDLSSKEGHRITALFRTNAIFDHRGQVVGSVHLITDISERKERSRQLHQANQELEQLLYIVTHDLKEPLRAVQSFADLVSRRYGKKIDPRGQDYLSRIKNAGQRLRTMLDHIRTLLSVRRMDPPSVSVDSRLIVLEALRLLEPEIKQSGATIHIHSELPWLVVNPTWALQAVHHLISNALKYSGDEMPPEIEIASYDGSEGIGLLIKDNGSGVSPQIRERIFQLFQRGVGREIPGTGAGLTIVRKIAQQHGGYAWVNPREGQAGGSQFVITFR